MSRYITELTIPNDMEFYCQAEDLIQQGHKEYTFTRFTFYDESERYPLGLFPKGLRLEFAPVTILYGNNGSGKSTILNLMAENLEIGRRTPINNSPFFSLFAKICQLSTHSDFDDIDRRRDIITSDDVFKHCFTVRDTNREIMKSQNAAIQKKVSIMRGEYKVANLHGLDDFERYMHDVK